MNRIFWRRVVLFCAALFCYVNSFATHLRAGEIILVRQSCSNDIYTIVLHVYTKNSSTVKFEGGTLSFGDGSPDVTLPRIDSPDPGFQLLEGATDVGQVTYTTTHRFPGNGTYIITYFERNRNIGVLNITNSVDTPFFIQTEVRIDNLLGCNNTPRLLVPPIDRGCKGVAWLHNPGAYDPDGDSLSYELFVPKQDFQVDAGYTAPNSKVFYDAAGIPYTQANEMADGPPIFKIDAIIGTITWDAPGEAGEYNIAFLVKEWRKINGRWISMGYVERDMQIVIEDCHNERPELMVPPDICVVAGTVIDQDIFATDPDGAAGDSVKIEAFSQVFAISPNPATYTPGPSVWQPTLSPNQQASIHFNWKTDCKDVKDQPYTVVFKATDNGSPRLATFKTWNIKVIAPPPQWNSATLNPGNRSSTLSWKDYTCKDNALTMQIWRRVDSYPFTPPPCLTGIPDELGYSKVGEVPIGTTTFVDRGLAAGAEYCYRLVAVFPNPPGGVSVVSDEICIPPIIVDAPVITNVTVDITDSKAGQIKVVWRPPFQADQSQFPGPYSYKVYRAQGLAGKINFVEAFPGTRPDTTWADTGINTVDFAYNYRVLAFASNTNRLDTSAVASSVRLDIKPLFQQMELNWTANVPWSNNTIKYPYHLIYRALDHGAVMSDMTLIDSVDVNKYQFHYIDSGQWNKTALSNSQKYCYAVMTRGSYGNPKIQEPLINFSEITCSTPDDKVPPCKPVLAVTGNDCSKSTCVSDGTVFSNTIKWNRPADEACRADTKSYTIYAASHVGQAFEKIAEGIVDTFYVHSNIPSYAQCYKVSAVDRAGNESDLSDSFCFDNCPYYELPNVFTPNGDDCNDKFSAYSLRYVTFGEPNYTKCNHHVLSADELDELSRKCARFVLSVSFKVYNRWGKEVYAYQGTGDGIYIDWSGKDNNGVDLAAGTYFYAAVVTFNVVDPRAQTKTIKGWVQIVR